MSTALATGGTGFIAIYVVKLLLERGSSMHTTVRRLDDRAKCQPLLALQAEYPWKLEIFQADLLKDGSFNQAMQGCELVYHVASPLLVPSQIKDSMEDCVEPALRGPGQYSIAATYSDSADILAYKDATLSKAYWNETSTAAYDPYKYSKVAAEREAWKMKNAQSRWDMVVINPGLVIGPSLPPQSASGSLHMLQGMYHGENKSGVPELHYPIADVRDVAEAHIRVGTSRSAKGRYIVASDSSVSQLDMANLARPCHRDPKKLPTRNFPKLMIYAARPFMGLSMKWVARKTASITKSTTAGASKSLELTTALKRRPCEIISWHGRTND